MDLQIFQVDAFTSKLFGGNPAAVVPLTEWLPAETMQNIALENNLAETAFLAPEGDGYGLRWFTPTIEIDLCGHATLASAYVLYEILGETKSILRFQTKSGELAVARESSRFVLDFPSRPATECEVPAGLVDAVGGSPKEIVRSRDYMLVYETEGEVLALQPNFAEILKIPTHAIIATAPGTDCDFVSRFFAPEVGVFEDPVTGSAHCTLIPYWAARLGKNKLFARQVSARGGELFCELVGERVKIGGEAKLYLKGEIYVEASGERSIAA